MHPDHDHSPEEHGAVAMRPLRPYLPPRRPISVSRRNFLRGTGLLMALPFLDSLPAAAAATAGPAPRRYPQRFAAVFMGNGINSKP